MIVHSVSELAAFIKACLEDNFYDRYVEGEVSEFKVSGPGHWYFTIKDDRCLLRCVVWASQTRGQQRPMLGAQVRLFGSINSYAQGGSYTFAAVRVERTGAGDLAARLEALRKKLANEGVFAEARKRALPPFPRAVGIATASGSAALADMQRILFERFPILIVHAPCRVQGEGAADDVASAITRLNDHPLVDVIIAGRGGGSAEDLWAFNEEVLVRAIVGSRVPVVSAVGHESDVCLCDLAADVRAATPTAAAALVVQDHRDLLHFLSDREDRLNEAVRRRIQHARQRLAAVRLLHPRDRLQRVRQRLDELRLRLDVARQRRCVLSQHALGRSEILLRPAATRALAGRRDRVAALEGRLLALSPEQVLERGYAIVLRDGVAVRDAAQLSAGDQVTLRLSKGSRGAIVAPESKEQADADG